MYTFWVKRFLDSFLKHLHEWSSIFETEFSFSTRRIIFITSCNRHPFSRALARKKIHDFCLHVVGHLLRLACLFFWCSSLGKHVHLKTGLPLRRRIKRKVPPSPLSLFFLHAKWENSNFASSSSLCYLYPPPSPPLLHALVWRMKKAGKQQNYGTNVISTVSTFFVTVCTVWTLCTVLALSTTPYWITFLGTAVFFLRRSLFFAWYATRDFYLHSAVRLRFP